MVYHITKNKWMQGPETDLSIDFFYSNIFIDPKQNYALLMNSVYSDDNREMRMVMLRKVEKLLFPSDGPLGSREDFPNLERCICLNSSPTSRTYHIDPYERSISQGGYPGRF